MVMNRWLDHWQTHSFGNWAISLLTNPEKIIGFGGLGIRNYDDIVINNLGYRLSTEAWGKGLATEFAIYAIKEEITGKALREMARRDEIVVATKTFFPWRNSPNTGFLSRKAIFQSIDDSLMRLGMDYVDLFQIHRFDYSTPVEETMEALHDVVKAGKARYIGASSMEAWRFAKMQHTAERNGWTRFITMQPQYNLLYREEEREMLPLCEDQGVGVIPWSPMARGRLTRDWSVTSRRTQNDAFALKMYENAALLDKPVIDVVASIAEKHAVPRAHVAIAWLLSKSVITAPIIGATKPEHLSTAISALDFSLSDAEITELEARYLPHPVDGIIPPLPDTPPSLTPPSAIQNY